MDLTITFRLAIALALGLIIGLERGWEQRFAQEGARSAGVRTFGLVGLFGGLSSIIAGHVGASFLAVALFALTSIIIVAYVLTATRSDDFGTTTELALFITFGLGALAARGLETEATALAVIIAGLLRFKGELHRSIEHLDRQELTATLQLLIIAAVILPLLPNRDLGPWQALNPRTVGMLILLVAAISYVGYFAVRLLGPRLGILASAVLGGLASSTAVTVSFSRIAKENTGAAALLGVGISLAAATMVPRLLLEIAFVNPTILPQLVPSFACVAGVPLVAAVIIARRIHSQAAVVPIEIKNPLELGAAFGFGLALTVLFLLVRGAEQWAGDAGVYIVSAISGIVDVDAVSLSLARAATQELPSPVAVNGIIIAVMVNTAVKAILATVIGGWMLARWCATILFGALSLGLVVSYFS